MAKGGQPPRAGLCGCGGARPPLLLPAHLEKAQAWSRGRSQAACGRFRARLAIVARRENTKHPKLVPPEGPPAWRGGEEVESPRGRGREGQRAAAGGWKAQTELRPGQRRGGGGKGK